MQISVIIPAYNEEKYLSRAIDSALNQSVKPSEILVVNDGSTDKTAEVAESYGGIVKHIFQENRGMASAARNTGIRTAKGEYIALLDADDEWKKYFISNAIDALNESGANWYVCSYERKLESGEVLFVKKIPPDCYSNSRVKNYFQVESAHHFSIPNSMIIKASVFKEIGMFDESIGKYGEDLDMWFRIALIYPMIAYSEVIGSTYWMREGSLTTRSNVDLKLFIDRIHKSESAAYRLGVEALEKSEVLVMDWVWTAIKVCVKQNDKKMLRHLLQHYYQRLSCARKIEILVLRILPNPIIELLINFFRR